MAMPLDLGNLRAAALAARLGSFTRAAQVLNLSQPALSRRIGEVEHELGIKLFERQPRGVRVTEAGLAFLRHAESALNSIDSGREAARHAGQRSLAAIDFGFLENLCDDRLIAACQRTLAAAAGSTINFRPRARSADLTADLLSGAIKLGLRYGRDPEPQVESLWLADDPIVIACAASHPLADKGSVTLDELANADWIGMAANIEDENSLPDDDLPTSIYSGWAAMKLVPIFARLKLVSAGFGLALVRRACLCQSSETAGLVELRTPLNLSMPIFLASRRGACLGSAEEQLRGELQRAYHAESSASRL